MRCSLNLTLRKLNLVRLRAVLNQYRANIRPQATHSVQCFFINKLSCYPNAKHGRLHLIWFMMIVAFTWIFYWIGPSSRWTLLKKLIFQLKNIFFVRSKKRFKRFFPLELDWCQKIEHRPTWPRWKVSSNWNFLRFNLWSLSPVIQIGKWIQLL